MAVMTVGGDEKTSPRKLFYFFFILLFAILKVAFTVPL